MEAESVVEWYLIVGHILLVGDLAIVRIHRLALRTDVMDAPTDDWVLALKTYAPAYFFKERNDFGVDWRGYRHIGQHKLVVFCDVR